MAQCNIEELVSQSCANGFDCLPPNISNSIELRLWQSVGGTDEDVDTLLEQACANGFLSVAQIPELADSIELQLLCNILN